MGIMRCPRCGKLNFTDNSKDSYCPNCGQALPKTNYKFSKPIFLKVAVGFVILIVFVQILSVITNTNSAKTANTSSISGTSNALGTTNAKMYKELGLSSESAYSKVIETLSKIDGFTKINKVKSLGFEDGIRQYWLILDGYYSEFKDNVVSGDVFWLGFKSNTDEIDSFYVNAQPVYENGKVLGPLKKYTMVSSVDLDTAFYIVKSVFRQLANDPSSIELNLNDVLYGKSEGIISVKGSVYGKNAFNATVKTGYELKWNTLTNNCEILIDGKKYTTTISF